MAAIVVIGWNKSISCSRFLLHTVFYFRVFLIVRQIYAHATTVIGWRKMSFNYSTLTQHTEHVQIAHKLKSTQTFILFRNLRSKFMSLKSRMRKNVYSVALCVWKSCWVTNNKKEIMFTEHWQRFAILHAATFWSPRKFRWKNTIREKPHYSVLYVQNAQWKSLRSKSHAHNAISQHRK